jgi:hypothetical protein
VGRSVPAVFSSTVAAARHARFDSRTVFAEDQKALLARDYSKAEQGLLEILKIDPHSVGGYANLGVVYVRAAGMTRPSRLSQKPGRPLLWPRPRGSDLTWTFASLSTVQDLPKDP